MKSLIPLLRSFILNPFEAFIQDSRAVGILLLVCTTLSLLIANSNFAAAYLVLINTSIPTVPLSFFHLPHNLLHVINDGLMTIFFFMAGMEIKREIISGELSKFSQAILPIVAALGGMLAPAVLFFFINRGSHFTNGWGIPMATDIAFSLGIAALLGSRVSLQLKVFLTALAIIDDLGAILAIALFYSSQINWIFIGFAFIIIAIFFILAKINYFGFIQFLLAFLLWCCIYNSGIHATVSGVIFAFFIPTAMLHKFEQLLHRPVNFIIIPLFALANTAIIFPPHFGAVINTSLFIGIVSGLLIGKPLGIFSACYICVKLKWGVLPAKTGWRNIIGVGLLAGIGFTMSIFIASLAFKDAAFIDIAKIASLTGSLLSIIIGSAWIYFFCKPLTS